MYAEQTFLLRVENVNGKALEHPKVMRFAVPDFSPVPLGPDPLSVQSRRAGRPVGSMEKEEIDALRRQVVGSHHRLLAYECAALGQTPSFRPPDTMAGVATWVQRHGSHLVLLDSASKVSTEQRASLPPGRPIDAARIFQGEVAIIGLLGLPLGTTAAVEAVVIRASPFANGLAVGGRTEYGLLVDKVNGRSLGRAVALPFFLGIFSYAKLGRNDAELRDSLNFLLSAQEMTLAEAEEAQRRHLGSRHALVVYESGGFSGVPTLPAKQLRWSGPPFGFCTWLNVMVERPLSGEIRKRKAIGELADPPQLK